MIENPDIPEKGVLVQLPQETSQTAEAEAEATITEATTTEANIPTLDDGNEDQHVVIDSTTGTENANDNRNDANVVDAITNDGDAAKANTNDDDDDDDDDADGIHENENEATPEYTNAIDGVITGVESQDHVNVISNTNTIAVEQIDNDDNDGDDNAAAGGGGGGGTAAAAAAAKNSADVLREKQLKSQLMKESNEKISLQRALKASKERESKALELVEHVKRDLIMSKSNSSKAMKRFEVTQSKMQQRIQQLEKELAESRKVNWRLQDIIKSEKQRQKVLELSLSREINRMPSPVPPVEDATEREALAVHRGYTTLACCTNNPTQFDLGDLIKRSERLIYENMTLREEARQVNAENAGLLKNQVQLQRDMDTASKKVENFIAHRAELERQLAKARQEVRDSQEQITQTVAVSIKRNKIAQRMREEAKWSRITPIPREGLSTARRTGDSTSSQRMGRVPAIQQ